MRGGLHVVDSRDEPFMVVLGSPAFYGRFGFVAASEHGVEGPYEAAGDAFQVRPRAAGVAPIPAGTVVYPSMFDSVRP